MIRIKRFVLLFLVLVPAMVMGQADQKLKAKAENGDVKAMVKLAECYEDGAGVPQDSAMALQWYQRAADKGSGEAWVHVSSYYLRGTLLPKDTSRYVAIRKEWADKGDADAMAAMANTYLRGTGVVRDTAKAIDLMQKAAKKGSPYACLELGDMYMWNVYGLAPDEKKSVDYWKKAFNGGELFAAVRLKDYYDSKEDFKTGMKYLEEGVKWNNPHCLTSLAEAYFYGRGVEMDEVKAQKTIRDVVDRNGDLQYARSVAGHIFMVPDDATLRDSALAMRYWKEGSALGSNLCRWNLVGYLSSIEEHGEAMAYLNKILENRYDDDFKGEACLELSRRYYYGIGCEANNEACINWLKRGVEQYDNALCASTLASFYNTEEYADPLGRHMLAEQYFEKAYKLGSAEALDDLAEVCIANGNMEKAMDCYKMMIDNGDKDGYYKKAKLLSEMKFEQQAVNALEEGDKNGCGDCTSTLGVMYERNDSPDYKKAAKYYEKAGTAWSYYRLALLYLNGDFGKGSDKDIKKGLDYLYKSRDMGQIDAYLALAYCYETGTAVGEVDYGKAMLCYEDLAGYDVPVGYFKLGQYYENGVGDLEVDSVKAMELYHKAADLGHGEAMCYIGDFYRIGQFVPMDQKEAFRYYSMADEAGEEIGTYYVGRSYLEGCGVEIDTAAAIPYLRRAAEQEVGRAAYLMGCFYDLGKGGLPVDGDSAIHYYVMGHDAGSGEASYKLGAVLTQRNAYEQAYSYIYTAAQRGNVDAIVLLGLFLQEGVVGEADPQQAYQLFELAATRAGDARAYTYMGKARLQGNGCQQSETLGKLYLDTAANLGNAQAMYLLGICYLQGYGCTPDSMIAAEWVERGAANGNLSAINLMGDLYEEQEDYENAVRYYQMGYDAGSMESCCNLGYCYEKGQGVILNIKKAMELYTEAANQGSTRGMKMLANCYLDEVAGEPNPQKAVEWLTKAAEAGDAQAMYMLGSMYEEGDTDEYQFTKDLKKAKQWYQKSAEAGYEPAQAALNRMK